MPQPNLVIILIDQMRLQAMGFWNQNGFNLPYANDPVHTPNLDRLAQQSVVLTQAVSNTPICSPYRGMLMSSRCLPKWRAGQLVGTGPNCELPQKRAAGQMCSMTRATAWVTLVSGILMRRISHSLIVITTKAAPPGMNGAHPSDGTASTTGTATAPMTNICGRCTGSTMPSV